MKTILNPLSGVKSKKHKKSNKKFKDKFTPSKTMVSAIKETNQQLSVDMLISDGTEKLLTEVTETKIVKKNKVKKKSKKSKTDMGAVGDAKLNDKYPILNDTELIKKFSAVSMNNNQKGRIRQVLRDNLQMSDKTLLPDVINNKMQNIIKSDTELTDSDLRKLRILYNMLKTTLEQEEINRNQEKEKEKLKKETNNKEKDNIVEQPLEENPKKDKSKDAPENKDEQSKKGPKRYVVFVGNLPLDVNKNQILQLFSDVRDGVANIRLPEKGEDIKSCIAYVELKDELSYQLALSKHHAMLGTKRINVLYTTQKNSKVTKTDAKGKTSKIIALQKSGKLLGSVPLHRKRSQRRKKMKEARARERDLNN